jgi:hypothetical protein
VLLGGNVYVLNGNNFYLTKNGKNIAFFSPISTNNNFGNGKIIMTSGPQMGIPSAPQIITTSGTQMR